MSLQLNCEIVRVTPSFAEELLSANLHNRPLRAGYVHQLARAMRAGEWTLNGEPIQVATDDTLLNGQHRLHAVVESGVTVTMLIIRGVRPDAQRTLDSGARRTLSDVLKLHDHTNTASLAAAVALLHRYRKKARMEIAGHSAPTPTEALTLLRNEPEIVDGVHLAHRAYREAHLRISVGIVLCHLFEKKDPEEGRRFLEALCTADTRLHGEPLSELRRILTRAHDEPTYVLQTYALCALTIKTFNAWRAGEEVHDLRFRNGERFPTIRKPAKSRDGVETTAPSIDDQEELATASPSDSGTYA